MTNPFEELQNQLTRIEGLMIQILRRESVSNMPLNEEPIGIERVAELLNLSESRIYQNPAIPRHKRHGKLRFFESEILAYIKSAPTSAKSEEIITRRPSRSRRKTVPLSS